jgi:hypothetical protein
MPAHVVANWLGHSVKVQNDHYAQVDQHHFERFSTAFGQSVALQVAQQGRAPSGTEPNGAVEAEAKVPCIRLDSLQYASVPESKVTPQGLEPQLTEPESVVLPITPQGSVAG